ncbi:RTA1 like protein-domain-containing protein [Apodospora peruviana]|uniref:RTA1 like protein-domain-containing protein n=1 Tax=Apodospora peruviana TaxID=516989 RepID=A0AAE0I5Y7_9PEZI|nr:RTA1 like protein-domain-containing protein [Apodospora peruviana]
MSTTTQDGAGAPSVSDSIAKYYLTCTELTPYCPVEATTLGYFPNKGINIFFAVGFGAAALATLAVGTWKKTWSYMAFITAGCVLELAGYASRIPLSSNPWNHHAFETQIVAIILAPTVICISIYLTLKYACISLNPDLSRVRPHLYPFIFVPLDVSCLLVQAIGGALAASAGYDDFALLQHGNRAIIAGITLQVVVLLFFGAVATDYYLRVKRWILTNLEETDQPEAVALWRDKRFRMFVYAVTGAYAGILIRCIYRIAEMAGGWGNHIMQDEPSFIVLEGFMILIPCLLLASFPAGILFPQMAARMSARGNKDKSNTTIQHDRKNRGSSDHGHAEEEANLEEGGGENVMTIKETTTSKKVVQVSAEPKSLE